MEEECGAHHGGWAPLHFLAGEGKLLEERHAVRPDRTSTGSCAGACICAHSTPASSAPETNSMQTCADVGERQGREGGRGAATRC